MQHAPLVVIHVGLPTIVIATVRVSLRLDQGMSKTNDSFVPPSPDLVNKTDHLAPVVCGDTKAPAIRKESSATFSPPVSEVLFLADMLVAHILEPVDGIKDKGLLLNPMFENYL